jgi:hypothetical protein
VRRDGPAVLVVDESSSLIDLPSHMENPIPLDKNHSDLVKFNSERDSAYQSVKQKLTDYIRDAPAVVQERINMFQKCTLSQILCWSKLIF